MISRRKFIQNTGGGLFLTAIPYSTNALNNIKKYELTAKKAKHSFKKIKIKLTSGFLIIIVLGH